MHWTAALTNSLGPYVPAVVCGNQSPGSWVNSPFPNANWITYPHTCSAGPAEHSCLGNVDEFYKTTFTLAPTSCNQSVATPSAYCLSLDFYADNWVWAIWVNNNLAFNNPNGNPYLGGFGFAAGFQLTASLCNFWQPGTNTIIVHVKSGAPSFPGWTGFLAQANQTVNPSTGIPLSANVTQTNVTCFGGNNGIANVSVSGPSGPYTYTWLPSGGNSAIASNLIAGIYTVTAASPGGCSNTQTINISQPAANTLNVSPNATICSSNSTTLTANGANTYTWSNGTQGSTAVVNMPGVYTVTGTALPNNCILTGTTSVTQAMAPAITIGGTAVTCQGGGVTLAANGANSYTWNTGATGNVLQVSPTITTVYSVAGNLTGNSCAGNQFFTVTVNQAPSLAVTGNTAVCMGNSTTLNVTGGDTYTWSTTSNNTSVSVSPSITTNYTVSSTNTLSGCSTSTLITVFVALNPTITIASQSVCAGETATVLAQGALSYTWSNGQQGNPLIVIPASNTIYTVTGSGALPNCTSTQTVIVSLTSNPLVTIAADKAPVICKGDSITLTASGTQSYYWWPDGITTNTIIVAPQTTTTFSVTGFNNTLLCSDVKTIEVIVRNPPTLKISGDSVICQGDLIKLKAQGAQNFMWNTGETGQRISIKAAENDVYTVTGFNETNCLANTSFSIILSDECCELFIPNSFSPNDDNKNDFFGPKSLCLFKTYEFSIFNRWGEKIFSSDNIEKRWDGFFKGQPCPYDIYVYVIDATKSQTGAPAKRIFKTGHVTLVR